MATALFSLFLVCAFFYGVFALARGGYRKTKRGASMLINLVPNRNRR